MIAIEVQGNKIGWRLERDPAIVYEHCGAAIGDACRKSPLFGSCVRSVIISDLALSLLPLLGDEVEFDVIGEHRADGIEVSRS